MASYSDVLQSGNNSDFRCSMPHILKMPILAVSVTDTTKSFSFSALDSCCLSILWFDHSGCVDLLRIQDIAINCRNSHDF